MENPGHAAFQGHGAPEILNTDQGSQFTSIGFTDYATNQRQVRLSMDGKGRALEDIFIERLWRSIKYGHIYLFSADDGLQCYRGLEEYFGYYNTERRHQSLDDQTPSTWYRQRIKKVA
ncbi:integrase core domain-containing protein [Allomuricauda taeanensis]|nr:integrase core domain-containing protein [Allomuricauda taeanensis]